MLFGDSVEKKIGFRDAGITTFWITMIVQLLLIMFFLYSVPATEVYEGRKILAAIALASGSFHLAGIPFYNSFFTGNMLELNFVVQLGIIGAVTLSSLGIFVLHELFSPRRLRQRLADPSIDWSFFAKVSVFVGGVAIVVSSMLYWMLEKEQLLVGKNITESAIATVYEVSVLRGFGVSMFEERNSEPLASAISMVLAGPFSNGSGLTLLVFVALAFVSTYGRKSAVNGISGRLMWKLMILTAISLTVAAFGVLSGAISFAQIVPAFTGNSVDINPDMGWGSVFWFSWLMLSGKLSLVVAAFWLMWMVGNAKK